MNQDGARDQEEGEPDLTRAGGAIHPDQQRRRWHRNRPRGRSGDAIPSPSLPDS
jgi:hypothetical protein